FDEHVQPNDHPNESHLSANDSGGAIFLNDSGDGVWKLAGINYAVDDLYAMPDIASEFAAAIFDARGYYTYDGTNFTLISGPDPVPTGFYDSRISSELAWIGSVIATPQVGFEGNFLTLTYNKLLVPNSDLTYTVEQSSDLMNWTTATTQDEPGAVTGDIQVIKAKIPVGAGTHLFARLRVTRPPPPPATNLHSPAAPVKMVPIDD
ncbi:MAG TPA: hypothetical protein VGG94_06035, partial [Chthoniobacterales bacterium]